MIEIALVEDNPNDRDNLIKALDRFSKEENEPIHITHFSTGEEFIAKFKAIYNVIFLDIELGGMNGMSIAQSIRKVDNSVFIIFCTNIAALAIKGYEYNALDYFIKPVSYQDLVLRMKKVVRSVKDSQRKISFPIEDGIQVLLVNEIIYIESFGHDTIYHTKDKNIKAKERKSMKSIEDELGPLGFSRCNVSYLINLRYLDSIKNNDVILYNGETLSISRNRKKDFLNDFFAHLNRNGGISQ